MRRMGWLKLAAIAGGILIVFLLVGGIVGAIIHALGTLLIAALVVGGIVVAIKVARSGKQVSGKKAEREVPEPDSYRPLPRADVEPYTTSVPTQQPRSTPNPQDIDDELSRLKREMGN
jgi:predicted lipid-binding transport protein (Tim44 family)